MRRQLLSKLQIYVEKWAGIIELLANDGTPSKEIGGNHMDIAIAHIRIFEEWAMKAYSIINPNLNDDTNIQLNKKETIEQLLKHYPNMNKNLVSQGLGISRSLLSPCRKKGSTPEVNTENNVIN